MHFLEASALSLVPPQTGYEVYILMEYCSGGGLLDLLNSRLRNRLTEKEILEVFSDICLGVAAMHHLDPPIAHRDLKIENILITAPADSSKRPTYKLCDFGSAKPILSRRAPRSMDELKRLEADLNRSTTLPYRPPEMVDVYQRRVIDEKADIWALGVLLYKLCYYTTPFEENGGGPLAILNVKYRFPSSPPYSDRVKGLIASLLVDPSSNRPSIDDLILRVHGLLGTEPPASALHFARLSASGKKAEALPRLISQSEARSNVPPRAVDDEMLVRIAKQRWEAPVVDLTGSQLACDVQSPSEATQSKQQPSKTNHEPDLISFMTSSAKDTDVTARAQETQRLMKIEGIEPMRRGRPGSQASPFRTTPSSLPGKLDVGHFGLKRPALHDKPAQRSPMESTAKNLIRPDRFEDSLYPTCSSPRASSVVAVAAASIRPPVVGTTSQGRLTSSSLVQPQPQPMKAIESLEEQDQTPESDPAIQGTSPEPGEDLSVEGRFPTLEELDRNYPDTRTVAPDDSLFSNGKAEGESSAKEQSHNELKESCTPALSSRQKAILPHGNSVVVRTQALQRCSNLSYCSPARFGSIKAKPVPPLPNHKLSVKRDAPCNGADDTESSSNEDEGPEDASASESIRSLWSQYHRKSPKGQEEAEMPAAVSQGQIIGKVSVPGWLSEPYNSDKRIERNTDIPLQPVSEESLIDFVPSPHGSGGQDEKAGQKLPFAYEATVDGARPISSARQACASAWDWDGEDAEEVRKLRAPKITHQGNAAEKALVDIEVPELGGTMEPVAENATSGNRSIVTSEDLLEQRLKTSDRQGSQAQARTVADKSTDTAHASPPLSTLVPSREKQERGLAEMADASTSPQDVTPDQAVEATASSLRTLTTESDVVMVGGHRAYAKGTAQSMASRWENMGCAIQNRPTHYGNGSVGQRIGVASSVKRFSQMPRSERVSSWTPQGTPTSFSSTRLLASHGELSSGSRRDDILEASSVIRPAAIKPQPVISLKGSTENQMRPQVPAASLKPWEREEAEKLQVEEYGHARRDSVEDSTNDNDLTSEASLASRRAQSASSPPVLGDEASRGAEGANGDLQNRRKSVASLIDRWQANARGSSQELGWGQIGHTSDTLARFRLPGRDV